MPNHIINRITLSGDESQIKKLIEKYKTHYPAAPFRAHDGSLRYKKVGSKYDFGWYNEEKEKFSVRKNQEIVIVKTPPEDYELDYELEYEAFPDFRKIKRMPDVVIKEGLGGDVEDAIRYLVNSAKPYHVPNWREGFVDCYLMNSELIKKGIESYKETGFIYWYDWNIGNWGTKWNSYSHKRISERVFEFQTAWSDVAKLCSLILNDAPDVNIFYEWADEDIGSNAGFGFLPDVKQLQSGSKEAYEQGFKLMPEEKVNYRSKGGSYEYVGE